jgi:Flp pilus assembly protein TadG
MTACPARRRERGQALAEAAIALPLFVLMALAMIEFGRAWLVVNMITHAARDGARIAAAAANPRDPATGMITNSAAIQSQVLAEISNVMPTTGLTVNVTQPNIGGIPMAQVQVTGTVPYLFNVVGTTGFPVARTVTFRDEGR